MRGVPGDPAIQLEGIFKTNGALLQERKDIRRRKCCISTPFTLGGKNSQGLRAYLMKLEEK